MNKEYRVILFRHRQFLEEQRITIPGEANFEKVYDEPSDTILGACVKVESLSKANIKIWADGEYTEKNVGLKNGHGLVGWESNNLEIDVVIRPQY